jgi:hypothetical protein
VDGTPNTVLVLGAGASVAEAKRFRPSQDRDHPPLDSTFFMRVARHASKDRLKPILDRAATLGQRDVCSAVRQVSLEQYLGRLYFEMHNERTQENLEAYFDLVRLYAAELLTTTNWMAGRAGSLARLLKAELNSGNRVSIVTFNHDLLAENALDSLSVHRYGHVLCLRHAYGLGDIDTCRVKGDPVYSFECPGDEEQHVPIYKMHGSLNWVFRTLRAHPSLEFARKDRAFMVWNNKVIPPDVRILSGKRRDWYLWPLVIPPIYEKHAFIHGRLRKVWDQGAAALMEADRVIFYGYSFPNADLHARYFFQGASHANEALRSPVLVNPDPAAHAALWATLRPREVQHFNDVEDLLAVY